ncbi:MAG: hypothetical protein ACI4MP_00505 [Candidatus Ventricola sp.]
MPTNVQIFIILSPFSFAASGPVLSARRAHALHSGSPFSPRASAALSGPAASSRLRIGSDFGLSIPSRRPGVNSTAEFIAQADSGIFLFFHLTAF